jgi:hypothetical protein
VVVLFAAASYLLRAKCSLVLDRCNRIVSAVPVVERRFTDRLTAPTKVNAVSRVVFLLCRHWNLNRPRLLGPSGGGDQPVGVSSSVGAIRLL